jgi:hypothetical protein
MSWLHLGKSTSLSVLYILVSAWSINTIIYPVLGPCHGHGIDYTPVGVWSFYVQRRKHAPFLHSSVPFLVYYERLINYIYWFKTKLIHWNRHSSFNTLLFRDFLKASTMNGNNQFSFLRAPLRVGSGTPVIASEVFNLQLFPLSRTHILQENYSWQRLEHSTFDVTVTGVSG